MVEPDLTDEYLDFGRLTFPVGRAFASPGLRPAADNVPVPIRIADFNSGDLLVGKRWAQVDNHNILVETVDWKDIAPKFKDLQQAAILQKKQTFAKRGEAMVATLRGINRGISSGEVQVASSGYAPKGVVIDYQTPYGTVSSFTFASGTTYDISTSFTITGTATFQAGCVIKYENNAYVTLSGASFSFPSSGTFPVFTSKDDDSFGERITGSSGSPTYMASPALAVYYVASGYTLQNCRFRYCKTGVSYAGSSAVTYPLQNSLFQQCQTGIYISLPSNASVSLTGITKSSVNTTIQGGPSSGTMTDDSSGFYLGGRFAAIDEQSSFGGIPPDTMGAVGPNHFMALLNGLYTVAVYDKATGARKTPTTTSIGNFFTFSVASGPYAGTYPTGTVSDPRLLYDAVHQRWIASVLDGVSSHVLLAVSNGPDPVGAGGNNWYTDNWKRY